MLLFQEIYLRHSFQPLNLISGIKDCNTSFNQEFSNTFFIKIFWLSLKSKFCLGKDQTENTPHVILEIRIVKSIFHLLRGGGKLPNINKRAFSGKMAQVDEFLSQLS